MDGSSFDALTRAVTSLRSRRGLAQLLLSAAIGSTPAFADLDEADAKRGQHHKRRKQSKQRSPSDGVQVDKKQGKKPKPCPPSCKKPKIA